MNGTEILNLRHQPITEGVGVGVGGGVGGALGFLIHNMGEGVVEVLDISVRNF